MGTPVTCTLLLAERVNCRLHDDPVLGIALVRSRLHTHWPSIHHHKIKKWERRYGVYCSTSVYSLCQAYSTSLPTSPLPHGSMNRLGSAPSPSA